jgi:hypothetical protein
MIILVFVALPQEGLFHVPSIVVPSPATKILIRADLFTNGRDSRHLFVAQRTQEAGAQDLTGLGSSGYSRYGDFIVGQPRSSEVSAYDDNLLITGTWPNSDTRISYDAASQVLVSILSNTMEKLKS